MGRLEDSERQIIYPCSSCLVCFIFPALKKERFSPHTRLRAQKHDNDQKVIRKHLTFCHFYKRCNRYVLSILHFHCLQQNIFQVSAQCLFPFLDDAHHRTISDKDSMISLLHLQSSICLVYKNTVHCLDLMCQSKLENQTEINAVKTCMDFMQLKKNYKYKKNLSKFFF